MKKLILAAFILTLASACTKELTRTEHQTTINANPTTMNDMVVPASFSYKTTQKVNVHVTLLTNRDEAIKNVRVDLMDNSPENGGRIFATGITNANGVLDGVYELPAYMTEIVVNTDFIGIVNNVVADIHGNSVSVKLGGRTPELIRTIEAAQTPQRAYGKGFSRISYRLGTFTSGSNGGLPNYLVTPRDYVSAQFLADINASLPERQPVPTYHPNYLSSSVERNLNLTELCDVWVSFIHEGAGYQNSLFYFVYNKNHKPTSVTQIDSLIAVFPNASYTGSGGSMTSGDKVYIGRWGADTCIGFAIAAYGWTGSTISTTSPFYYSIKDLNPESSASNREHVVTLYHDATEKFMISFEDLNRESGADNDFNDVVITAAANPVSAVKRTSILESTHADGNDDDNDGVNNENDDYPNDASKAFNQYYPTSSTFASVAFEDLWPSQGDYDMNDVVVNYQYKAVLNANNKVVSLTGKYKLRAAGGIYHNGFSVELPVNASTVSSISGGLGLESDATKAIVKVFSNSKDLIPAYNTFSGHAASATDTITVNINFSTPQTMTVGTFNPFIYVDESGKGRGYEVHLPDMNPTEKATTSVLGTNADNSIPASGRYYKTKNNLPFAINIPESFSYPSEKNSILDAYTKFATWAQSGGTSYSDWYQNKSGYRTSSKIY